MDNQRVPPMPKSLSNNANLSESSDEQGNKRVVSGETETTTTNPMFTPKIDEKLAILKQEMASLRQIDFDLLTQLTQLRQSIDDFKESLQANLSNGNGRPVINGSGQDDDDTISDGSSEETASSY